MKVQDPQVLMKAPAAVAPAPGVNKVAQEAGVNRESLYKSLISGLDLTRTLADFT